MMYSPSGVGSGKSKLTQISERPQKIFLTTALFYAINYLSVYKTWLSPSHKRYRVSSCRPAPRHFSRFLRLICSGTGFIRSGTIILFCSPDGDSHIPEKRIQRRLKKIVQAAISEHFRFFLYHPEGILQEYISVIWASDGIPPFKQERIIPDAASVLLFNFGDPVLIRNENSDFDFKKALFTGVFSHFNTQDYAHARVLHSQVGVIFKPGGAYPFIHKPIIDFKNVAVEIPALGDRHFENVYEQMGESKSPEERIVRLEKFLLDRLKADFTDNLAPQLINLIRKNPEKSIGYITQKTGYTQQHLNRLLGKFAGTNAKSIQKIFRLNRAIQSMGSEQNLADVTYGSGYFDQAHFIHDFKEMTGMTPKEFLPVRRPDTDRVVFLY